MTEKWKRQPDSIPTRSIQWDSSWPELLEGDSRYCIFKYLEERFGIPSSAFDAYLLLRKGKGLWLLKDSVHRDLACHYRVSMVGMRAFQIINDFIKPSTRMIQVFGHLATRSKVDLDKGQLAVLAETRLLEIDLELTNGYVILCFQGKALGMGLFIRGQLRSQLPRRELPCLRNAFIGKNQVHYL